LLIARKANVNLPGIIDRTCLSFAAGDGYDEGIKILLQAGAKVDPPDRRGCTPLIMAATWQKWSSAKILIEHGANIHHKDKDCDSFLSITRRKNPKILKAWRLS